jgi:hypothetical protein
LGDEGGELGGDQGLDVVGRHEQARVHGVVVGAGGRGDGVDALLVGVKGGGVGGGRRGEGEEADVGFVELAVDLRFACCDLLGRH